MSHPLFRPFVLIIFLIILMNFTLISPKAYSQSRRELDHNRLYEQRSYPRPYKVQQKRKSLSKKNIPTQIVKSTRRIETPQKQFGFASSKPEVSLGMGQSTFRDDGNNGGTGQGFRLGVGAHFDINESWTTSSFLKGSYDFLDEKSIYAPFGMQEIDVKSYDLGLAQRVTFKFDSTAFVFAPFIEGHAAKGRLVVNESSTLTTGQTTAQTTLTYTKVTGAVGIQLEMEGFIPFVKYEYGTIIFDDAMDFTVTDASGKTKTGSSSLDVEEPLQYTFSSVSGGIRYHF